MRSRETRRRFGLPRGYGRDPYRKRLKPTAPLSNDPRQLPLPDAAPTATPAPSEEPCPQHQVDLEEWLAAHPPKEPQT